MNLLQPKNRLPNLLQLARDNAGRAGGIKSALRVPRGEAGAPPAPAEAHVYVYGVIGAYWGDVAAQDFANVLAGITADTVHLHVNSPGGDVFEARAMMAAIAAHPAKFVAHVDGLAASAASWLIFAADEIEIVKGGFLMVHNSWTIAIGNTHDFTEVAAVLAKFDEAIAADYVKRTGKDAKQVAAWMDDETWFTAEDSIAQGFADRMVDTMPEKEEEDDEETAEAAASKWNLAAYDKVPEALRTPAPAPKPAVDPAASRARSERHLRLLERTAA